MLVSEFSRRFMLYYNVSSDTYAMNQPTGGTLFERVKAAESVKQLLGTGVAIVKFTTKGGKLKRLSPYSGRWMRKSKQHRRPRRTWDHEAFNCRRSQKKSNLHATNFSWKNDQKEMKYPAASCGVSTDLDNNFP
jgi:hypothetical protein